MMYTFREPIIDEEFLEQGGCGTCGEFYYVENPKKLFTGTFISFYKKQDTLQDALSSIMECKDGVPHGLCIAWNEKNGTVVVSQFAKYSVKGKYGYFNGSYQHGDYILWNTRKKTVLWRRFEYNISLEAGSWNNEDGVKLKPTVLSKKKKRELKQLRERFNLPIPPTLRDVPVEELYEMMPDERVYFERFQHSQINEEGRRQLKWIEKKDRIFRLIVCIIVFVILTALIIGPQLLLRN